MDVITDVLRLHMKLFPPADQRIDKEFSQLFTEAAKIVGRMQAPDSTITAFLQRRDQNLSDQDKNKVHDELQQEISEALKRNIPLEMINTLTTVFVTMLMAGIKLDFAEPVESIVLCLRCLSLESLLRLKEMILSGLLLRILSDAIKQFIQCETRVQLIIRAAEFNKCASYFCSITGEHEFFHLALHSVIAN